MHKVKRDTAGQTESRRGGKRARSRLHGIFSPSLSLAAIVQGLDPAKSPLYMYIRGQGKADSKSPERKREKVGKARFQIVSANFAKFCAIKLFEPSW